LPRNPMRVARFWYMTRFSFSGPESLSGHPKASAAAAKDQVCFFGGTAKAEPVQRMAGEPKPDGRREPKQKTAVPPGAARPVFRPSSEAVPERRRGRKAEIHGRIAP
jgi:hypothetical protein